MAEEMRPPPRWTTADGSPRHIGVEVEFAGVTASDAAQLIHNLFGGTIEARDPHRFVIKDTSLGDFVTELDSRLLHPEAEGGADTQAAKRSEFDRSAEAMRERFGHMAAVVVPCEIVTPPVPLACLPEIDRIIETLRARGAHGTRQRALYAFGLHVNTEAASLDAAYLTAMLQSYTLLSDWLRDQIQPDITRRILPFSDPFPPDYCQLITSASYKPSLAGLIEDYLHFNPTRNRELDMLPLFSYIDNDRVRRRLPSESISTRPTFHYRLPDARIGSPVWRVVTEWNRWVLVERLADDPERRTAMMAEYQSNLARFMPEDWGRRASRWLDFPTEPQ